MLIVGVAVVSTHRASAARSPIARVQPGVTLEHRPTVINFFASWCDPCRTELPLMERASQAPGAPVFRGVDVLDQRSDADGLIRRAGVTFPVTYDRDGSLSARWGVVGLPVTVFADAGGRVIAYHRGELREPELDRLIGQLARAA